MSIKLNKHSLPDEIINQMKTTLRESIRKESELGFTLCADEKDNLYARNICTGEECKVVVKTKCRKQEKFVGTYHTHYDNDSQASTNDLINCGSEIYTCIGGKEDNHARCYVWQHEPISDKKYSEFLQLIDKGTIQIDDPLYKKNFECMIDFIPFFLRRKIIDTRDQLISDLEADVQWREHEKSPDKTKIDKIKKDIVFNKGKRKENSLEYFTKKDEVTPKYFKEKILW